MEKEFSIQRKDGDYFHLRKDEFPSVFRSSRIESTPIAGEGYCIQTEDGKISFLYEDEGILVVFKDYKRNESEMKVIMNEISKNLAKVAKTECIVLNL